MRKQPLDPIHRERIRALIASKGVCQSADLLGTTVHTIERAYSGLALQPGTVALLTMAIAKRTADGRVP